jgi:hypothetical protein
MYICTYCSRIDGQVRLHDEQTVNGLRKISFRLGRFLFSVWGSMSPCHVSVNVSMSMSPCPCFHVHVSMSMFPCPYLHVHVSMSTCLHVSMSPCPYLYFSISSCFHVSCLSLHVSMTPSPCLHVSMTPCPHVHVSMFLEFRITVNWANGKTATSVCLLQTENGNSKLPFVCCKRKRKTEKFCFPWSANDKRSSMITVSAMLYSSLCTSYSI